MKIEAGTSVGDIAAASALAASVLERYGIDYCCHGKTSLEEACRVSGVSPENVKDDLAQAVTAAGVSTTNWNTAPLRDLVDHIVTKHHEYLKLELPRVGQRVRTVARVHGEKDPAALHELEQVFDGLAEEMNLHMHKEEMMLFPAIERLEASAQGGGLVPPSPFGTIANPISVMEHEHDSSGNALTRIRELTRGYEVPPYACSTYRAMLEGLKAIEADLHVHIHLENNILFPRAIALERNN